MNPTTLTGALGRRASRRTAVLVTLCASLTVWGCLAVGLVVSGYQAQAELTAAAAPRTTALFPDEVAVLRAMPTWDDVDGRSVEVTLVQPLRHDAPLPPSLTSWPEPGHFLTSADLADDASALSARWGAFDGTLDPDHLPSAYPRTVIARPVADLTSDWDASGFGLTADQALVQRDISGVSSSGIPFPVGVVGVVVVITIPACLLLICALAARMRELAPQLRVLEVLGARPVTLHRAILRGLAGPWTVSLAVVACTLVLLFLVPIPLPWAQYTIRPLDIRSQSSTILISVACGAALAALVIAVMTRPPRLAVSVRPAARRPGHTPRRTILALIGVVAVLITSQLAYQDAVTEVVSGRSSAAVMWLGLGCLVAIGTMSAITGTALGLVGDVLASMGRRRDGATGILVGRLLGRSDTAGRMCAVAAILIVTCGTATIWTMTGAVPAVQAQQVIDRIDGRFFVVYSPVDSPESSDEVIEALPAGISHLTLDAATRHLEGSSATSAVLRGTAQELGHWDLDPGRTYKAQDLPDLLGTTIVQGPDTPVTVTTATFPDAAAEDATDTDNLQNDRAYIAFRMDGGRPDRDAAQRALTRAGGIGWEVGLGGELEIVGAQDFVHTLRWVPWFATLSTILLLACMWIRTSEDQREVARSLAPVDALFAPRPRAPGVLAGRTLILAVVGCGIGGATALLLARMANGDLTVTGGAPPIIGAVTLTVLVATMILSLPVVLGAAGRTRSWTPGDRS